MKLCRTRGGYAIDGSAIRIHRHEDGWKMAYGDHDEMQWTKEHGFYGAVFPTLRSLRQALAVTPPPAGSTFHNITLNVDGRLYPLVRWRSSKHYEIALHSDVYEIHRISGQYNVAVLREGIFPETLFQCATLAEAIRTILRDHEPQQRR